MRRAVLALAALLAGPLVSAQTTFSVAVVDKTSEHPAFGQGHSEGFAIDGVQGAEFTLVRGQTYVFRMKSTPSAHPFYITTSSTGGGSGTWDSGVTGNRATGTAELTFTVPEGAPDELWYQCGVHAQMGGRIAIVSASSTGDEAPGISLDLLSANPTSDVLRLRLTGPPSADVRLAVFAVDGRQVTVLYEGPLAAHAGRVVALDVTGLAAGVYVVRGTVGVETVERRVTVVR